MAPRRGGGSGGGGVSIDNQCSDYGAFENGASIAQIAILGVLLLLFLILAWCASSRATKRKKENKSKSILKWYHWGIAIFLDIVFFILFIINFSLQECGVFYYRGIDATAMSTAISVVGYLADTYLYAIVLFIVINKMLLLAGSSSLRRIYKILSIVFFLIVTVIGLAVLIISILANWDVYVSSSDYVTSYNRLAQASAVLYVLLAVFAGAGLILAWIKLGSRPETKQGVTTWIPVLMICLFGYTLTNAITLFLALYGQDFDIASSIASWAVSLLLFFFAYFSIFMISRGVGWEWLHANSAASDVHTQPVGYSAPYDPQEAKRQSGYSGQNWHQSSTPAPPYAGPYSGNGNYEPQGQTYNTGSWGAGGYAPVHQQQQTSYNAPVGAASRDMSENELMGRR